MGRVPCRLELVQCGSLGGIVRRELVDDEHAAARPCHACKLGDDALGPRDVMERPLGAGEVEFGVRESQRLSISFDELRVRQSARPRELEELGHRVDPDDLAHERCERKRQRAGSGADVESALVTERIDEVAHFFGEAPRAAILAGGDALRRPREPLSR